MKDEMEKARSAALNEPSLPGNKQAENQPEGDLGTEIQKLIKRLRDSETLQE